MEGCSSMPPIHSTKLEPCTTASLLTYSPRPAIPYLKTFEIPYLYQSPAIALISAQAKHRLCYRLRSLSVSPDAGSPSTSLAGVARGPEQQQPPAAVSQQALITEERWGLRVRVWCSSPAPVTATDPSSNLPVCMTAVHHAALPCPALLLFPPPETQFRYSSDLT